MMGRRFDDGGSQLMREEPPLPTQPPFTAFVVNLSFESTESDVQFFFEPLKPISVRLVSGHDGRPRGYGYVEFETLDELKHALTYSGKPMDNRSVRVSVAEPYDADQWRRSTPLPSENRGGFGGGFGGGGVSGFENMNISEGVRSGFGGKFAPGTDSFRGSRQGPRDDADPGASDTASDWRTGKPVAGRDRGFGRPTGGPEGGFGRRLSGGQDDSGSNWRGRRSGAEEGAPMERKKLDLKPRGSTSVEAPASSASSARPNPFGNAKPVDSADRERAIQEKMREQDRQRRKSRQKEDERRKNRMEKIRSGPWTNKVADKDAEPTENPSNAEDAHPKEDAAAAPENST
ncbi:Eukaryotic translation initiation factor 4B [Malassezia sp. CBS 17886]|nr:Eukaryotic translation initiation factor 4B [Malassezia sp. CBS 17886]